VVRPKRTTSSPGTRAAPWHPGSDHGTGFGNKLRLPDRDGFARWPSSVWTGSRIAAPRLDLGWVMGLSRVVWRSDGQALAAGRETRELFFGGVGGCALTSSEVPDA